MTKIAVLIPCYNEEATIGAVVADCKKYLPKADIYVYDNNSTDNTIEKALAAGANVLSELRQGKGNVVRRMFSDVEADVYVMVDGDATYDIKAVPSMIEKLKKDKLDMVVGARREKENSCYRYGHRAGNKVLTKAVEICMGCRLKDMLSGLRVFSKRYVKTFPARSNGFEIETELTVYALSRRLPILEVETDYFARPEQSFSKLSTYKDGFRILKMIVILLKEERPLMFFGLIALLFFVVSLAIALPVVAEYLKTGLVPRFPTAFLASSLMICSLISFLIGLVLDSVSEMRREISRNNYLNIKPMSTR